MAEAITLVRALSGGESRSPSTASSTTWIRPGPGRGAGPAGLHRLGRPEIPGRHRTAGRRLDPAGRLGLAEPALPRVPPPRRRRRGRGGPGPGGDRQRLQLRRPHHPRTARRHPGRGRPLDRRLRPAVGRRAHRRGPGPPRGRLHLPQPRRHPRRRGPGPLGHRGRPRRPRRHHPIAPGRKRSARRPPATGLRFGRAPVAPGRCSATWWRCSAARWSCSARSPPTGTW